ncbi:MAG: hypothetical protein RLY86_2564 [Pseudomonadota bacterium]|jgi:hypothetical protein
MAPLNDRGALLAAWKGMTQGGPGDGWQTILLGTAGGAEVRAAKLYPEGAEAFLIGFSGAPVPADASLPQAKGFRTSRVKLQGSPETWVAVTRQPAGSIELFASMTTDVLDVVQAQGGAAPAAVLRQAIARIAAWQRFMERGSGLLTLEEELGLHGELVVLGGLLEGEADKAAIVEAWLGPLGGLHDFRFGPGALEVKSTLSGPGFPASISNLEQLDTSVVSPLFIAAIRHIESPGGMTLGDLSLDLLDRMARDPAAKAALKDRLLAAGLPEADFGRYTRRLTPVGTRVHLVDDGFPRLVRGNMPPAIVNARYVLDLDLIPATALSLPQVRDLLRNS